MVKVVEPKRPVDIVEPHVVKDVEVIESLVVSDHVLDLGGHAHVVVVEAQGDFPPIAEHAHVYASKRTFEMHIA